jgi:hypothetical protein
MSAFGRIRAHRFATLEPRMGSTWHRLPLVCQGSNPLVSAEVIRLQPLLRGEKTPSLLSIRAESLLVNSTATGPRYTTEMVLCFERTKPRTNHKTKMNAAIELTKKGSFCLFGRNGFQPETEWAGWLRREGYERRI